MIRWLIAIPIIIAAIIVTLSLYLQPNDLVFCHDTPGADRPCQAVDAIVAVSGGDTNARTDEAIRLFKNGWANIIIFSGAAKDKTGLSNAAAMEMRAVAAGVPEAAIYLDEYSETTRENAENVETIFENHDISHIILVTSGYHQRRASIEFDRQAPEVTVVNYPVANDQDWSWLWWTNARGWSLAVTELFKVIALHVQGVPNE